MRLILTCLSIGVLGVGCGDGEEAATERATPPERLRACGELDGVEPVEPVTIGTDIEEGGCPVFAPVPCTQPLSYYYTYCGSDCGPAVGVDERGDEWLLGCARHYRGMGCADVDYQPKPACGVDPFEGNTFWYTPPGCPVYFNASACWSPCDDPGTGLPAEECWSP